MSVAFRIVSCVTIIFLKAASCNASSFTRFLIGVSVFNELSYLSTLPSSLLIFSALGFSNRTFKKFCKSESSNFCFLYSKILSYIISLKITTNFSLDAKKSVLNVICPVSLILNSFCAKTT
uniref:(northern house mosquito) hypothetical protein n=1 Tax=Culex pipiens TaxID=7175 RepID=A0A8D8CHZ7_CULPI